MSVERGEWLPTACILCSCNCGIEVQVGGENDRHIAHIRGDRSHPVSKGYLCQKATRLDHYQNHSDRLRSPMRRRADGSFEEVDWDTAIREVAERLLAVRNEHGGESILYYGGGGQGNHLPGAYASATRRALGSVFISNALAQEKTGEIWVAGEMFGGWPHGDFDHCEVGIFLGKNPWQSHGIARARVVLREIAKDPDRTLIVIDPCRTESADLADFHLQPKPASDAWLLAAMLGVVLDEGLLDRDWLAEHTTGLDEILPILEEISVSECCSKCGVDEDLVRAVMRRIAQAQTVSVFEDLGVQMNRHSTLVSYLQRLVWLLPGGSFGAKGGHNLLTSLRPIANMRSSGKKSPVQGAPIIGGLLPCNILAEEILSDHPKRYRAMICESANPVHSLADSQKFRAAMERLDFSVVIDVAMTETARHADYVLPTATQYEKAEATFFNLEFPDNAFHLRHPLFEAPSGVLAEAEIHSRLVEAMGAMPQAEVEALREALTAGGRPAFAAAFFAASQEKPELRNLAPVVLYRALGPSLPEGLDSAAVLWGVAHLCARLNADSIRRAGIEGEGPMLGENLFDAILESRSGVVFSSDAYEASWGRVRREDRKIRLDLPELFEELRSLGDTEPFGGTEEYPFLLSAGERRSFTANTIYRDPRWRKKDPQGALRVALADAERLGIGDGEQARLTTKRASTEVTVETCERMMPGHLALPNGLGLDYPDDEGERRISGVAPNEMTASEDRDWLAGTPWHKSVPARLERLET